MLLQNDKLLLRALEPEDLKHLYRWENDTSLWAHGSTLAPYSQYALRQYIEDSQQYDISVSKQLRLIITLKGTQEIIGAVDIFDLDLHDRRAGVGILVDEKYRNQGYALQSLDILKEYCFDFLDLHQLYAHVSADNTISLQLFYNAGYKQIGVLKDWKYTSSGYKDIIVLQLIDKLDE